MKAMRGCPAILFLAALLEAADTPYDIWKLRQQLNAAEAQLSETFGARVPPEARLPNGAPNPQHPAYQAVEEQYAAAHKSLLEGFKARDPRYNFFDALDGKPTPGVFRPEDLGGIALKNTGSVPRSPFADMDFTPGSFGDAKKIIQILEAKGFTVVNTGLRWEVRELDMVIWKPMQKDGIGAAQDVFVGAKAMPHSDAAATEGSMWAVSNGTYGVRDEYGAALANVKKGLDARAKGMAGEGDFRVNLKDELKSVAKAADYGGMDLKSFDKDLYETAKALKDYATPERAGVYSVGDPPEIRAKKVSELRARIDAANQKALETGAGNLARRTETREALAKYAREQGNMEEYVRIREEMIKVRASNEVTLRQLQKDYPQDMNRLVGEASSPAVAREKLAEARANVARERLSSQPSAKPARTVEAEGGLDLSKIGNHAMTALWVGGAAASAYTAEQENAIREGRQTSKINMAANVLKDLAVTPYLSSREATQEEIRGVVESGQAGMLAKAMAALNRLKSAAGIGADASLGRTPSSFRQDSLQAQAAINALWKVGQGMGYTTAKGILEEEALKEFERVQRARRSADELRREGIAVSGDAPRWDASHILAAKIRGAIRIGGEMTMMTSIFDAWNRDFGAERGAADMNRRLQDYTRTNAEVGFAAIRRAQEEMQAVMETGSPSDPAAQAAMAALVKRYGRERDALQALIAGMKKEINLGPNDPLVAAIEQALAGLPGLPPPDPPALAQTQPPQTQTARTEGFTTVGQVQTLTSSANVEAGVSPVAAPPATSADACEGPAKEATLRLLQEAQVRLIKPRPTQQDSQAAADLIRQARDMAPPCMAQQVAVLSGSLTAISGSGQVTSATAAASQRVVADALAALAAAAAALNRGPTQAAIVPSAAANATPSGLCDRCSLAGYRELLEPESTAYRYDFWVIESQQTYPEPNCPGGRRLVRGVSHERKVSGSPFGTTLRPEERLLCERCTHAQARQTLRQYCPAEYEEALRQIQEQNLRRD